MCSPGQRHPTAPLHRAPTGERAAGLDGPCASNISVSVGAIGHRRTRSARWMSGPGSNQPGVMFHSPAPEGRARG
jgi:hypothetical protein